MRWSRGASRGAALAWSLDRLSIAAEPGAVRIRRVRIERRYGDAHSTQDTVPARFALRGPADRRLRSVDHIGPSSTIIPSYCSSEGNGGALWLSRLAARQPLHQFPLSRPAGPQRPTDPRGSPAVVLERSLHTRHGMAAAHANRILADHPR